MGGRRKGGRSRGGMGDSLRKERIFVCLKGKRKKRKDWGGIESFKKEKKKKEIK